ncbi:MAG: GNAT family N-acetyltransferase, partial [Phycisphaeraceae bacterium]|nr:GNAT family N-acetyltransferase [Phycisphaeraceae bacterium]
MADLQIHVGQIEDLEAGLRAVRDAVFIDEQNVPKEIEWDGSDAHFTHVLVTDGTEPIACGRIDATGRVGRMAVVADRRGEGIGAMVLERLEAIGRGMKLDRIHLSSQVSAIGFYEKLGYQVIGETFEEAAIPHRKMVKRI